MHVGMFEERRSYGLPTQINVRNECSETEEGQKNSIIWSFFEKTSCEVNSEKGSPSLLPRLVRSAISSFAFFVVHRLCLWSRKHPLIKSHLPFDPREWFCLDKFDYQTGLLYPNPSSPIGFEWKRSRKRLLIEQFPFLNEKKDFFPWKNKKKSQDLFLDLIVWLWSSSFALLSEISFFFSPPEKSREPTLSPSPHREAQANWYKFHWIKNRRNETKRKKKTDRTAREPREEEKYLKSKLFVLSWIRVWENIQLKLSKWSFDEIFSFAYLVCLVCLVEFSFDRFCACPYRRSDWMGINEEVIRLNEL